MTALRLLAAYCVMLAADICQDAGDVLACVGKAIAAGGAR